MAAIDLKNLDWTSKKSHVLAHPKSDKPLFRLSQGPDLSGHLWVSTSGSESGSQGRWVALSKEAFLAAAHSVNTYLELTAYDRWVNPLPLFHVGGLSVEARAYLGRFEVLHFHPDRWDAKGYYELLQEHQATVTSMVPTQVFDLVSLGLKSPSSLKFVLVGGAALSNPLYQRARHLGWRVLPSYGMTESCGAVAAAPLESLKEMKAPSLEPLSHTQIQTENGFIKLFGPSLLTGSLVQDAKGFHFIDPKEQGWFTTQDQGEVQGQRVWIKGRASEVVKVGGEFTHLARLQQILEEIFAEEGEVGASKYALLVASPSDRLGHQIDLVVAEAYQNQAAHWVERFNQSVLPFEKIRQVHTVLEIPRNEMGKVLRGSLDL